jgi:cysteine synthase
VIDRMIPIPDAASIATIRWLQSVLGRKCGGSTGTNPFGALRIIAEMLRNGEAGSVVTMICDPGERYPHSYDDDGWLRAEGIDIAPYVAQLEAFATSGQFEIA